MRITTGIASAVASFFGSFAAVLAIYFLLSETSAYTMGAGIYAAGLCLGIVQGWLLKQADLRIIGIWSFIAVAVLWIPVVLITYGFALLGLPLLAVYALVVIIGVRFGAGVLLPGDNRSEKF